MFVWSIKARSWGYVKLIMKKKNHVIYFWLILRSISNFLLLFGVLFEQFVDDVEFWFPPDKGSTVEYRSASRVGNFDFDLNRKRIKVWFVLSSYHVLSLCLKKFLVCRKKTNFLFLISCQILVEGFM